MSKIAVLLPREYMLEQAKKVIRDENLDIDILRVVVTADCVYEARKAVDEGAEIIVARGIQAAYIKEYTNIPLAEIVLTGQELGRLIVKAKKILQKPCPHIALIGFENMYSDTSYFDEVFDINLKTYFISSLEETEEAVMAAKKDGMELLIGGDVVNNLAREYQMPSIFIESTEESIRIALDTARKMSYAAAIESAGRAQFETVLDTSTNGIIRINERKEIAIINKLSEEMLGKSSAEVEGKPLALIVPEIEMEYIDAVLAGKRDTYTTSIKMGKTTVMMTMNPIQLEGRIEGAILACYRLTTQKNSDVDQYREMYLHGYIAKHDFTDIQAADSAMRQTIELAKMYALSVKPVLIYGEEGTGKELIAQSIHNHSSYKSGPFVSVNCAGMNEQMQLERLFGNPDSIDESMKKGALALGDLGTVLINEVEKLTMVAQYRLYRAIRYETLLQNDLEKSQTLDNRIIVTTNKDLVLCVNAGEFREDLYYLLNGLVLEVPPLRKRPQDTEMIVERCKREFSKRYSKYLKLSEAAMGVLKAYPWPGNEIQLESFLERLFLTTQKKTIHEDVVQKLLNELYPKVSFDGDERRMIVYKHPEAVRIAELLDKYGGNRAAVAAEMQISTTTLWRRIKKYGVNYL